MMIEREKHQKYRKQGQGNTIQIIVYFKLFLIAKQKEIIDYVGNIKLIWKMNEKKYTETYLQSIW